MQPSEIVHVIDDDEGVRSGLCALLETRNYSVKPHQSCEDFLAAYNPESTLCVVSDLRMPGMGGLDLQDHLLRKSIDLPFIVITGHGDVTSAVKALKSGAVDFIEKPIDGAQLIAAVGKAAASRREHSKHLADANLARERVAMLTPREREILRHLVGGDPNKIIAHKLNISARTVENHRARLMVKMRADSVAELVRLALTADPSMAGGNAD
jgi:two-component system, LuxR family, response regulator FixJ